VLGCATPARETSSPAAQEWDYFLGIASVKRGTAMLQGKPSSAQGSFQRLRPRPRLEARRRLAQPDRRDIVLTLRNDCWERGTLFSSRPPSRVSPGAEHLGCLRAPHDGAGRGHDRGPFSATLRSARRRMRTFLLALRCPATRVPAAVPPQRSAFIPGLGGVVGGRGVGGGRGDRQLCAIVGPP